MWQWPAQIPDTRAVRLLRAQSPDTRAVRQLQAQNTLFSHQFFCSSSLLVASPDTQGRSYKVTVKIK
jgi:hypothetical protein